MEDVVERIRKLRFVHIPGTSDLMEEACQEIERLRIELSVQQACTVAGRDEIALLRLAAKEREAIVWCVELLDELDSSKANTLRELLERLHT